MEENFMKPDDGGASDGSGEHNGDTFTAVEDKNPAVVDGQQQDGDAPIGDEGNGADPAATETTGVTLDEDKQSSVDGEG